MFPRDRRRSSHRRGAWCEYARLPGASESPAEGRARAAPRLWRSNRRSRGLHEQDVVNFDFLLGTAGMLVDGFLLPLTSRWQGYQPRGISSLAIPGSALMATYKRFRAGSLARSGTYSPAPGDLRPGQRDLDRVQGGLAAGGVPAGGAGRG